jgi:hypothetical protein
MPDRLDRLAKALCHCVFAITIEYIIEIGLQGRS